MGILAGDAHQLLAVAKPRSGIVTAEWNELPVRVTYWMMHRRSRRRL